MSFKTRLTVKLLFTYITGAALVAAGVMKNELLITMGATLLLFSVIGTAKLIYYIKKPQKLKELEAASGDERLAFIMRKSYSFAFWFTITGEFFGVCALLFAGIDKIAVMLCYLICLQTVGFLAARLYYGKKY